MNSTTSPDNLKLFKVEVRILDNEKFRSLYNIAVDQEKAREEATMFKTEYVEAFTIEEAIKAINILRKNNGILGTIINTIEVIAVKEISNITITREFWLSKELSFNNGGLGSGNAKAIELAIPKKE